MTKDVEIKVTPQKVSDGWLVFEVNQIVITGSHNYQSVSVTFKPPDYAPILYAHAMPGAGPKPEDTWQVQDLQDFAVAKLIDAREAIVESLRIEKEKQETKQEKGW